MTVLFQSGYSLPGADQPLTHARIAHAGNWLSGGTVTASSTATDYFEEAPTNSLTYEKWKPTATTFETWEYDHGSASSVNYCCIAAHTLGSTATDLSVQYWTGAIWQPVISAVGITTDEPIFCIFGAASAQRWRIATQNGTAGAEVGVVRFGLAMQMRRPLFGGHVPINLARQTDLRTNTSQTGEFLGRSKRRSFMSTGYEWRHLPQSWVHDEFRTFQINSETEPFFIAWRPGDYGGVGYGVATETPVPQNMGIVDLMQVSVNFQARAWD